MIIRIINRLARQSRRGRKSLGHISSGGGTQCFTEHDDKAACALIIPTNSREQRWPDFDTTWQNLLMRSRRKQCIVPTTWMAPASAVVKIME
jgi:hypothetical protein